MRSEILKRGMVDAKTSAAINVSIMQPVAIGEEEWLCKYEISSGEEKVLGESRGSDSMQAVQLAFDGIREDCLNNFPNATWVGLPIELAFPKPIPYVLGIDFYRRVEAFADQEAHSKYGAP